MHFHVYDPVRLIEQDVDQRLDRYVGFLYCHRLGLGIALSGKTHAGKSISRSKG